MQYAPGARDVYANSRELGLVSADCRTRQSFEDKIYVGRRQARFAAREYELPDAKSAMLLVLYRVD